MSPSDPRDRREGGFTLVEVMTAMTILAIMASFVFAVVLGSTRRSRALDREIELKMTAGSILNLMVEDIKGAYYSQGEIPYFVGRDAYNRDNPADGVAFLTTAALPVDPERAFGDLAEVSYVLAFEADQPLGVLYRREQMPAEPPDDEGGESVEVSARVRSLNLRYYDGADWLDEWDSEDVAKDSMSGRIPREIEVEIGLAEGASEIVLRTRVAPPMAKEL